MNPVFASLLLVTSIVTLAAGAQAAEHAATIGEVTAVAPLPESQKIGLEVVGKYAHYRYAESKINDRGNLQGIGLAYQYDFPVGSVRGELDYFAGTITYDGQYMNGTPVQSPSHNNLAELRALWVGPIPTGSTTNLLSYHAGLGTRAIHEKTDGTGTYTRDTTYLYVPIGIGYAAGLGESGWSLGASAEYDLFLAGQNTSHLSELGAGYKDTEFNQSKGYGARVAGEVRKDFGRWALKAQPFVQYWNIGESSHEMGYDDGAGNVGYFVEPDNNTVMYGLNLGAEM